MTESAVV